MSSDISFCAYCGKSVFPGAAFCVYCGKSLDAGLQGVEPPPLPDDRAIPAPPRPGLSGPCLVMLAGDDEMSVRRMGRLVAEATGRPLPDVTRQLRTSKGFVVSGIEAQDAVALAGRIENELDAKVLVIQEEDCVPMPPVMRMRRIKIHEDSLRCEAYTWDETEELNIPWDEVFLVSCGRLAFERVWEKQSDIRRSATSFGTQVPELVTEKYHEFLIDIVLFKPWRRLRLDYNTAGYVFTASDPDSSVALEALRKCGVRLMKYSAGVPMNSGVSFLVHGASGEGWEVLTFLSKLDFDSYTHWLIQRIRFGCGMPS